MKRGAISKGSTGVRKLPLDSIKEALADGRVHGAVGVVRKFSGESSHFELDGEDVLVDVELMPNGERVLCRLGVGAGPGRGFWFIPPEGTEVAVLVPQGDLDADPVVVGCLSSGVAPSGLSASNWVIVVPSGGQLLVHDGTSSQAKALATKDDVQALRDWVAIQFNPATGHKHVLDVPNLTTLGITEGTPPVNPAVTTPQPAGTSVLKGK